MSRSRVRLAGGVLLAAAVISGCAGKGSTVGSAPPAPAVCEHMREWAPADCDQAVRRLNDALGPALRGRLPSDAVISSNIVLDGQPGTALAVTFVPARDPEGGTVGYDAPLRVRAEGRSANLEIMVFSDAEIPESDNCPDQARLHEMARKGLKQNRCDRHQVGDAVVVVHSESQPYGSGEFATMSLENMSVRAYRGDGVKVSVIQAPVVEKVPDDPAARQQATEGFLTLEEMEALALDPSFTIG